MIATLLITFLCIFVQCKARRWPDGKYCLPMPSNGKCPRGWRSGHRYHDMEDRLGGHYYYRKISGWVPKNSGLPRNIEWGFCCKGDCKQNNYVHQRNPWPRGSYCIFRCGGSCPRNFHQGEKLVRAASSPVCGGLRYEIFLVACLQAIG